MSKCRARYLNGRIAAGGKVIVLDVGGADVNGSYRELFADPPFHYLVADIDAADGVDLVLADPYHIPMADNSVDVVISGQMLEHCEFFWLTFNEMVRVAKPDGYVFLIVPSAGPVHRYPVDCYRFYPDAYRALAKHAGCYLVDVWQDERGPWHDLVGVFRKHFLPDESAPPKAASATSAAVPPLEFARIPPGPPETEAIRGALDYLEILRAAHQVLAPSFYLEIGVRHGNSLALAECLSVGIDPAPEITAAIGPSAMLYRKTSDAFFEEDAAKVLTRPPDLVFIDGMHWFEYALRDFMHVERIASPASLVVIDDVFPNHPRQASRQRTTRVWTGDIWKLHHCLATCRPDLFLLPLDTSPTGLLLVAGLQPDNRVLWDNYNPIVARYRDEAFSEPPESVLQREHALSADLAAMTQLLRCLRELRSQNATSRTVAAELSETCKRFLPGPFVG